MKLLTLFLKCVDTFIQLTLILLCLTIDQELRQSFSLLALGVWQFGITNTIIWFYNRFKKIHPVRIIHNILAIILLTIIYFDPIRDAFTKLLYVCFFIGMGYFIFTVIQTLKIMDEFAKPPFTAETTNENE